MFNEIKLTIKNDKDFKKTKENLINAILLTKSWVLQTSVVLWAKKKSSKFSFSY